MTDRRAHWDDALVYAVIHEIGVLRPSPHSLRDTAYAVIAAVEDWMDANDNPLPHVLNECLQWLDAERAAIQRVREVCERDSFWLNDTDSFGTSRALTVSQVLKALDSDQ